MSIPVTFTRLPITSPCPVPVEPGTGSTFDNENEPLPMEQRTELCAVDAGWMIGGQRLCDYHLRDLFERGFFDGDFDSLVYEALSDYSPGDAARAIHRAEKPWADRKRYSQEDARSWHENAKEHGLA